MNSSFFTFLEALLCAKHKHGFNSRGHPANFVCLVIGNTLGGSWVGLGGS